MAEDFYMESFLGEVDEDAVIQVKQLTLECPAKAPLPTCPLSEFRELDLKERLELVDKLSNDQLNVLIQSHNDCFDKRKDSAL